MSKPSILACPISPDRIDESAARVAASLVIGITLIGLYFQSWPLFVLLGLDFGLRAFDFRKYSPLRYAAKWIAFQLLLPEKPIDAAPKKFAAGVGLVFSFVIAALLVLGWYYSASAVAGVLLVCALLETALGYCVGCVVYSAFVVPFLKVKN